MSEGEQTGAGASLPPELAGRTAAEHEAARKRALQIAQAVIDAPWSAPLGLTLYREVERGIWPQSIASGMFRQALAVGMWAALAYRDDFPEGVDEFLKSWAAGVTEGLPQILENERRRYMTMLDGLAAEQTKAAGKSN